MRGDAAEQRAVEVYRAWSQPVLDAMREALDKHPEDPATAILTVLSKTRPNTAALATALAETTLSGLQVPTGEEQEEGKPLAAAASDPQERIRIARLAAQARWRGHVKMLKEKIQKQYGAYTNKDNREAHLSNQFLDKAFSGDARKKSYLNGVPNLVHLHAARDIVKLWKSSKLNGINPSRKSKENGKIDYGRYETTFKRRGTTYAALITTRLVHQEKKEIIYSIEIFQGKKIAG